MKLLIVSYYWPPSSGSGVQRWMYFSKYLKAKGHNITVLTVDPQKASYSQVDPSFNTVVDNIPTIETSTIEPLKLYSLLTTGSKSKGIPQGHVSKGRNGFLGKVANFVRANFFVPDARVGWVRIASKKAIKVLRKDEFDMIITTGPPHSTHLIGKRIKEEFPDMKWLADFRDPWKEIFLNQDLPRINAIKKYDDALEKKVISSCDHLLCVSPSMKKLLVSKQYKSSDQISFIINGFDSDKMSNISESKKDKFTLSFIGLASDRMHFDSFITALKQAIYNNSIDVEVELAGKNIESITDKLTQNIQNISVVERGFVDHVTALEMMVSANIVFTVLPESSHDKLIVSGKLMEYLASGTPVLVVGNPEGDAAKILSEFEFARVFDQEDIEGMSEFMSKIMNMHSHKKRARNNISEIDKYSRKNTANELETLLERI